MILSAKEKQKEGRLLQSFLLTFVKWKKIVDHEEGICPVCHCPFPAAPHTDHNHDTGEVRGVLCHRCNPLLGKIENAFKRYGLHKIEGLTTPIVLRALLLYLENPPARNALGYTHIGFAGRVGTKKQKKIFAKMKKEGLLENIQVVQNVPESN